MLYAQDRMMFGDDLMIELVSQVLMRAVKPYVDTVTLVSFVLVDQEVGATCFTARELIQLCANDLDYNYKL